MKPRFPLFLKIVLWFFLNLALLGVVGYFILAGQFGLDLLVSGPVAARIGAVSEATTSELRTQPRSQWDAVLENRSSFYGVKFLLFQDDGGQLAGETTSLPPDVKRWLKARPDHHGPDKGRRRYPDNRSFSEQDDPPPEQPDPEKKNLASHRFAASRYQSGTNAIFRAPPPPRPRFVLRTAGPTRYWVGMSAFLGEQREDAPRFGTLLIASSNLHGGGLFFDAKPILVVAGWMLLLSVLFWFPLVRRITHSLGQMTQATERIAQGGFDVRVGIRRRDEIGQLGVAVNRMAERLQGLVTGQKRFLGDIAHELCTPLSRIQMALGILEQRAGQSCDPYVRDLREEVQQMSGLVAELLSFSKASLASNQLKLQPVKVRDIIAQAVQREATPQSNIQINVDPDVEALAEPNLLQRAFANLLRNAVRYAGGNGPIVFSSRRDSDAVVLSVADSGPGVPEQFLPRLFDPFFRVDDSRTRESGGVGLGLTIVKTCVEACGGAVTCRNREPSGLEVLLRLKSV